MAKKTFLILAAALLITIAFMSALKYLRPDSGPLPNLDNFPLQIDGWAGRLDQVDRATIELLNPDRYFAATYTNAAGDRVQLFFDYFSSRSMSRGIHSPRNCLPGAGWVIARSDDRSLTLENRFIPATRFYLSLGGSNQVMDFWYITRHGETSDDYTFKLFGLLSSLTFQPGDVAFVRIAAAGDSLSLAALESFEKIITLEIDRLLPL